MSPSGAQGLGAAGRALRPGFAARGAGRTHLAAAILGALLLAPAGCSGPGSTGARPEAAVQGDPAALVALADSAIAVGDAATARRALDRALAIAPHDPAVHLGRGRLLAAARRYHDAKQEFDEAASLEPESPEPPYQLGLAYLRAGETAAAIEAFGRALALAPDHPGAREAITPLLAARYVAAGIPAEYARLPDASTISRDELGVMLAVELGADPDRMVWRSDDAMRTESPELDGAWGARWLRAAAARGWIDRFPDGSYHLDDPVTRGNFALLLGRLIHDVGADSLLEGREAAFPDLPPRHYLSAAATGAIRIGLPSRADGRFEPRSAVTGLEALRAVRGLARVLGATPIETPESR